MGKELAKLYFKGNDADAKRKAMDAVRMAGAGRDDLMVEMLLTLCREDRTGKQNRWYFGYIVTPLAKFQMDQEETLGNLERAKKWAHRKLACECLGYDEVPDPATGEMEKVPYETHTLSIDEFGDYAERCIVWLDKFVGIPVTDKNPIRDEPQQQQPQRNRKAVPA